MRRRLLKVGVISILTCAATAAPAMAAAGDPSIDQCFTSDALAPCIQVAPNFSGIDVAVSPDGAQVYMLGRFPTLIRIFDRGADRRLTPRPGPGGCFNSGGTDGCTAVPGLVSGDSFDIEFSPDGTSLYVAAGASLAHLQRNSGTGGLVPVGCYGTGPGCTPIAPVGTVYAVEVSKDGQNVYTRGGGTFGAFQRNTSTGVLIPEPDGEDCFTETATAGCTDTYGLGGNAFELEFSPDGKFLYYPIQSPGGVGFFQRSANGSLTQISGPQGGCITTNGSSSAAGECATIADGSGPAMENGWAVTLSPSGRYAFLASGGGTVVFSRDQENGKLTKVHCLAVSAISGCGVRAGSGGMGVAVSPDGRRAVLGSSSSSGIGIFDFNEATGVLTPLPAPLGCFSGVVVAGCSSLPGVSNYGKTDWSADGLNFYSAAGGSVVNMSVDYPPVCQSRTATVPPNVSTAIGLSCSDPNGDPVTMSVSRAATAGVLAGVDQAASTVRYNPFANYLGPDSFGYVGVARGVTSAEATVALNVQSPPPAGPAVLASRVLASWKPFETYTTVKSLSVVGAPVGATLRLLCQKGSGCPFASKRISVKRPGVQKLTKNFNFSKKVKGKKRRVVSRLGVGTVVEVQVSASGFTGKAVRYTIRKGKQPSSTALCIPPGSAKAQRC